MKHLDYAIEMELDGQKYYLEQAEKNKANELHRVFTLLADSEKEHAALLLKLKNKETFALVDNSELMKGKTIFGDLGDLSSDVKTPTQLDAYRMAVTQEEKSIKLYQEMLEASEDSKEKELFEFLIKQEMEHLKLFEQLVTMLLRPEEWVEAAEFGVREEY